MAAFVYVYVHGRWAPQRAQARARGLHGHEPSPDEPVLVVAVDERAELSADALALLERLARMGRAVGIVLVAVTQRPSVAALGSLAAGEPHKPCRRATARVETREPAIDPDGLLLAALDGAPHGGLSADELALQLGRSRAWVYKCLLVHRSTGRAVSLRRGRWAAGRTDRRRVQ